MGIIAKKARKGNHNDIPPPREGFLARVPDGTLTIAVVVLASLGSFGLGMLAEREINEEEKGVRIEAAPVSGAATPAVLGASAASPLTVQSAPAPAPLAADEGQYVASKSGKSYHLLSCPGAKQIKEENKVYFSSRAEAEAAGYAPAKNCKGM